MRHVLNMFLRAMNDGIYNKLEVRTGNSQFSFRNYLGTKLAIIWCLHVGPKIS